MNFLQSLYCYLKFGGHCWMPKITFLRVATGSLEVRECTKCGMKTKRIKKLVGVK